MPRIVDPEVWIGQTAQKGLIKVYVVGRKERGATQVWILGSAEARAKGLPGFPMQGDGFRNEEAAEEFARNAFGSPGRLEQFVSFDLNPLSTSRPDAPILMYRVDE